MNERPNDEKVRIWQISPGHWTSKLWPEFKKEKIIAIDWELKLGSLLNYDKNSLEKEIRSKYNQSTNAVNSCWYFSREIKKGAIIVAKKGSSREVYGIGVAETEYNFDDKRKDNRHVIGMNWVIAFDDRVKVEVKTRFAQKTVGPLTEEAYDQVKKSILKRFPEMGKGFDELKKLSGLPAPESAQGSSGGLQQPGKSNWKELYGKLHADGRVEFVTFHPSYSYEEFVEGYKPVQGGGFKLVDGIFKKMCCRALAALLDKYDPKKPDKYKWDVLIEEWKSNMNGASKLSKEEETQRRFVLIVDEINRANISKVLGELIFALEYRGEPVKLTYSQKDLIVPPNLYVIGTMNTADTSIALIDVALRRRFGFQEFVPDIGKMFQILKDEAGFSESDINQKLGLDLRKLVDTLNYRISVLADREKQIGYSVFLSIFKKDDQFEKDGEVWKSNLKRIWFREVIPLLQQYFYNDYRKMMMVLGGTFVDEKALKRGDFCQSKRGEIDDIIDTEELRYELKISEDSSTEAFVRSLVEVYGTPKETAKEESKGEATS